DSWTDTTTTGSPDARQLHGAVWSGQRMFIWGGSNGLPLNSGASYDPNANSWSAPLTTVNAPTGRAWPSVVFTGTRLLVWGGSGFLSSGGQWVQFSLYQKN